MSFQTLTRCCFYLGLVSILPCASQTSRFTSTLYGGKTITGSVGSSVSFSWSFFGAFDGVDTIQWGLKKDGQASLATLLVIIKVSSGGPISVPVPPDYSGRVTGNLTGTKFSGQVILTLSSIKTSFKGYYGCILNPVSDFDSTQFDYVYLDVKGPPSVTRISSNQTVNEGCILSINCTAAGNPTPTISWTRLSDNSVVIMPLNISRSSEGGYRCTADNQIGIPATADVFVTVRYKPTIKTAVASATKSWIGQTVQLTCEADGRPTPTITWKKQDGSKVKKEVTAAWNNASVEMKTEGDFGTYTCEAKNTAGPAAIRTVEIKQIKAPGSPIITSRAIDIQATSLTVKWNAPTTNGGSPITAYRVFILRGGNVIRNENFTDLKSPKEKLIGSLNISTNYTVRVYARNFVFEGKPGEKMIMTKFQGVPAAAEILGLPKETNNTKITLKWSKPENNGKPIKTYIVYQRTKREDGTPRTWNRISVISDLSDLQVTVQLEKGKIYEFVVTATNEFGESLKEEKKIKKITVVGGVPSAVKLKVEQKDDKVILTWEKPDGNGAAITIYSVYHRVANAKEWEELTEIPAGSPLQYVFEGEKGKEYEFVVTASNRYGESPKADFKSVKVSADESTPPGPSAGRIGTAVIAGAGAAGALLILGLILFVVWWKRRKTSSDQGSSAHTAERGPNPDEYDDGYEAVGAASAARQLQACGPATDVTYAQPDMSQTDSWRQVTITYPKIDESKGAKKKPKGPFVVQNLLAKQTKLSTMAQANDTQTYATPISGDYMPLNPRTRSWEVMREQVDIMKVIGKGAFSQVAQATVKNARGYQEYITVAVKMLKANAPASDRKDLLSELDLMKRLKPHPHVIKLIGCVTESDPLLVLIEYVPFGDLLGYLRNSRGLNDKYYKDRDAKLQSNLTAEQLMKFAWQIADGMCYLSSKKIIHRDLAARNVLVGEGEVCKVTDFGMARNVQQDDIYSRKSQGRLPVKWTAYEALLYGTYTTQSDVWSYGVLLYEILTIGGSPYPTVKAREIAVKIQEGYRMPKPRHVDEKLYEIMLRCWEENPFDRPTFEKLRKAMKDMERNHRTYVNLIQYDDRLYANINDFADD